MHAYALHTAPCDFLQIGKTYVIKVTGYDLQDETIITATLEGQ